MQRTFEMPNSLNFLVVDESDSYRNLINIGLKKLGFKNVRLTSNGLHALQILKSERIDFIICERNMDELDGSQLLHEVRDSFDIHGTPFLMVGASGQITKQDVILLAEYEVDSYLSKPFTLKILTEKIMQCVEHYNTTEIKITRAKQFIRTLKYDQAIEAFNLLLLQMPNSARIRVCLAHCFAKIDQFSKAIAYCQEAIKKNSLYTQAYDELGNILLQQNQVEDALAQFNHAMDLSPNNIIRYNKITDILIENKRFEAAEELLLKAKDSGIPFDTYNHKFGIVLFHQGKIDAAVSYFEKALVLNPTDKGLLNIMGVSLKELKREEEALKYYNTALKHHPMDSKIMFNKSLCYIELKRFDECKKILKTLHLGDPGNKKYIDKIEELEKMTAKPGV